MEPGTQIIVIGEPNGQLKSAFQKLSEKYKKFPTLSFAIVVGNLFAEEDEELAELLAGNINIPLQTYFTIGNKPLPKSVIEKLSKDETLCENLHYLAKRSTTKTSEGIKIVTLGGTLDESIEGLSAEDFLPVHSAGDAKALKGAHTADILLTSQWPSSVRQGSRKPVLETTVDPQGDENVSELCAAIRPRYHLSTSNTFFEREPFNHPPASEDPSARPVTRFVSVAHFGNPKSLYAFKLSAVPAATLPPDFTYSPFRNLNNKRRQNFDTTSFPRFDTQHGSHRDKRQRGSDNKASREEFCFFCMSEPSFRDYLVTSIAEDSYLTLPKGPLTTSDTNSAYGISCPAHILICPIAHGPTMATMILPTGENRSEETYAEMTTWRKSLQAMVASRGKGALGTVTYEISRSRNVHDHWQFIPVDQKYTTTQSSTGKSLVEAAFLVEAENLSYPPLQARDPGLGSEEGDFFRVWIWTPPTGEEKEGTEKCLTMPLDNDKRFDLQFGRRVLAKLLGLEKRTNWWECDQTEEEEIADNKAFSEMFKEFDFSSS